MSMPRPGWWPFRPRRRHDPFLRAKHGDLDIVMPPPYDMSDTGQRQAREQVEKLVRQLQPGGLDGNSGEVLNNLINAWMDQEIARLGSYRDERRAVSGMLIGLAREEVARRKQRYEADYARSQHARQALAIAFRELTGTELTELQSPHPPHIDDGPLRSTLGPITFPDPGMPPGDPSAGSPEPSPSAGPDGSAAPGEPALGRGASGLSREYDLDKGDGAVPSANGSEEAASADAGSDPAEGA